MIELGKLTWDEISEIISDLDLVDGEPDFLTGESDKLLFIQALREEIDFRREFSDARRQIERLERAK